jgi:hypothetical protein
MAFVHGRDTVVKLDGNDLSPFANSTDFSTEADVHDTTTYGKDWHTFVGGLKNGTGTISGIYDNTAAGPRAVLTPLLGSTVVWIFQPQGVGSGFAQSTGSVVIKTYNESSPVADMISWTCEIQFTDTMDSTDQP